MIYLPDSLIITLLNKMKKIFHWFCIHYFNNIILKKKGGGPGESHLW